MSASVVPDPSPADNPDGSAAPGTETEPREALRASMERGFAFHRSGHLAQARALYEGVLRTYPSHPHALHHLGLILHQTGSSDLGLQLMKASLNQGPVPAHYKANLARVLEALGRKGEAGAIRQELSVEGGNAELRLAAATQTLESGRIDEGIRLLTVAAVLDPGFVPAQAALAKALLNANRAQEARETCEASLRRNPESAELHAILGMLLMLTQNTTLLDEGELHLRETLRLDPAFGEARANLASLLLTRGRLEEAEASARQALLLMAESANLTVLLGTILQKQLRVEECLAVLHHALSLNPADDKLHSSILWWENYGRRSGPEENLAVHLRWAHMHTAGIPIERHHRNSRDPERILNVGIPCADFRAHPAATFLSGIFEHHDSGRIRLFAYSDVETPDGFTARFKARADQWRDVRRLNDEALTGLIRQDEIDILIDRTGHMVDNRLLVFARKPAPIQVSYLGYANTRGLETIDYWLTDCLANPPETAAAYTERFWYLPRTSFNYFPPLTSPDVAPPPCSVKRTDEPPGIVFGSFNNGAKIGAECIAVWSKVLHAVPTSRLLLRGAYLAAAEVQRKFVSAFEGHGVAADRVTMEGYSEKQDYLRDFSRIDIALDPFPNNGATTTLDTLWMGVPVIALAGDTAVSRYGLSLLTVLGHPEWVASSKDEYVILAADLASDTSRLQRIRGALRGELLASPLCDASGFTREFEEALRGMWREWCQRPG